MSPKDLGAEILVLRAMGLDGRVLWGTPHVTERAVRPCFLPVSVLLLGHEMNSFASSSCCEVSSLHR